MDFRFVRNIRNGLQLLRLPYRKIHKTTSLNIKPNNVKEVRIPVPWGYIAGKWWGDASRQPILALHGWQDNAGTFDPLLELLPDTMSVLAVDSPGHGLSSHYPEGMLYNLANLTMMIKRVQMYFKWMEPMTILAHSQGAVAGFIFSALYPEIVNALVMIDVIKPVTPGKGYQSKLAEAIDYTVTHMARTAEENKKYSLEEIEKRWLDGTKGSLTRDAVKVLMRRGVQLDSGSGKYSLTRDPRLKIFNLRYFDKNEDLALASNIKCDLLVIKFSGGKYFDRSLKDVPNYVNTLKKAANSLEIVTVEGTHHEHLNHAKSVAPVITRFLESKL